MLRIVKGKLSAVSLVLFCGLIGSCVAMSSERSGPAKPAGEVYALTNVASGNGVGIFNRAKDGTLTFSEIVPTGGLGIGDGPDTEGLQSQGALVLSKNNKYLYAVNAGSNDITVFSVDHSTLTVVQKISSNGKRPIGIAIYKKLLYVLNFDRLAAIPDTGSISGFTIATNGMLTPITGSTQALIAPDLNPGQIAFSPDGKLLAMTAKNTDQIITYHVDKTGIVDSPNAHKTAGVFPFSLAFASKDILLTADDFDDVPGMGAASSYLVKDTTGVTLVSGAVPNHQDGTCWIVTTSDGKHAFVDNTNNSVVSGYNIGKDGNLSLHDNDGVTGKTGGLKPRDLSFAQRGKFLYTLNSASGTVTGFSVGKDGSLKIVGTTGSIPSPGSNGLAAW